MSEIKEADKDYMIFFDIEREDPYVFPMKRLPTIKYPKGEIFIPEDDSNVSRWTLKVVDYPLDVAGRYDTSFFYNFNLEYDDPAANEVISIKQKVPTVRDRLAGGDTAQVTFHSSPMIPRQFKEEYDSETETTRFSVKSSKDDTLRFELYSSPEFYGPYELIETMDNDPSEDTLYFQNPANESEHLYYKSRAIDSNGNSLFTLPIHI